MNYRQPIRQRTYQELPREAEYPDSPTYRESLRAVYVRLLRMEAALYRDQPNLEAGDNLAALHGVSRVIEMVRLAATAGRYEDAEAAMLEEIAVWREPDGDWHGTEASFWADEMADSYTPTEYVDLAIWLANDPEGFEITDEARVSVREADSAHEALARCISARLYEAAYPALLDRIEAGQRGEAG